MRVHGQLKPVIDRVLPLAEARTGHELIEQRAVFGKIVLRNSATHPPPEEVTRHQKWSRSVVDGVVAHKPYFVMVQTWRLSDHL
jgi:hypothetical protein